MSPFEFFDHAADVGIRVVAPTLADLFRDAGRGLMQWIGPAPKSRTPFRASVAVEGDCHEELLVRWLQELLYLFQARHGYMTRVFRLELDPPELHAEVGLCRWEAEEAGSYQEVKAVTYHMLSVAQSHEGWEARIILDI